MSSYHHIVISSYHHSIIKSSYHQPPECSHVWYQVKVQNKNRICYPITEEVSLKINELQAITFYEESASDAQKFIAPPKCHFLETKNLPAFSVLKKKLQRRKMKSCKSSETRFAKVSRRSEPCSRGKRPFKVSKKSKSAKKYSKCTAFAMK